MNADRIIALAAIYGAASVLVVAVACVAIAHIKRTHAPTTAADLNVTYEPWEAESDTPIFDRCAAKQADRLRAELDDEDAVARWINGGAA